MRSRVKDILKDSGLLFTQWGRRIVDASEPGGRGFGVADTVAAGNWVTCACGKSRADTPKSKQGEPADVLLVALGLEFQNAIANKDPLKSALLLVQIERRAGRLATG